MKDVSKRSRTTVPLQTPPKSHTYRSCENQCEKGESREIRPAGYAAHTRPPPFFSVPCLSAASYTCASQQPLALISLERKIASTSWLRTMNTTGAAAHAHRTEANLAPRAHGGSGRLTPAAVVPSTRTDILVRQLPPYIPHTNDTPLDGVDNERHLTPKATHIPAEHLGQRRNA